MVKSITDIIMVTIAFIAIVAIIIRSGDIFRNQEEQLTNAMTMYETARSDALLWKYKYEERADRLKAIEKRDAKMRKLIKDKKALPMALPKE